MQSIEALFHHNIWANLKLLDACRDLDDAVLDATLAGTYGSIRDTLVHIARAEAGYLRRLTGEEPDRTGWGEVPNMDQLRLALQFTGERLTQVASTVQPGDISQVQWEGKTSEFPMYILLVQAINHATEHRTHINTILTQQGTPPSDVDGWSYMLEMRREEAADD